MKLPKVRFASGKIGDVPQGTTRAQFQELIKSGGAAQIEEFDKGGFHVCYCSACHGEWK